MSFGNPNITQAAGTSIGSTPQGAPPATGQAVPAPAYPLVNGTGNIPGAAVTTPNDGKMHTVQVSLVTLVTANETGGQITVNFTLNGGAIALGVDPGGNAIGQYANFRSLVCDPGTSVFLKQNSALTAGTATLYSSVVVTQ